MRPILTSKKHYVQISQATVAQGLLVNVTLVDAIEGAHTLPEHVSEGDVVKAVFVEFWIGNASTSVVGSYTVVLYKNPGSGHGLTGGEAAALHDWTNKKNIFFSSQALAPPTDGGFIPVIRTWVKIPKGKQRFGLADRFTIAIRNNNSTSVDVNFCGIATYKSYS